MHDTKILLRKAKLEDANNISTIYISSRNKFVSFAPLTHSNESIYKWIYEVLIPTNQVIVAEESGIIVGMMALSKNESMGWINQLYLSPAFVGRGIGTLLLNKAKTTLGSPIYLYTFQVNIKARRFYEKHGFKIVKQTDGSQNEENCPDVLYEWRQRPNE